MLLVCEDTGVPKRQMQKVDTDLFLPEADMPPLRRVYGAVEQLKSSHRLCRRAFTGEVAPADWAGPHIHIPTSCRTKETAIVWFKCISINVFAAYDQNEGGKGKYRQEMNRYYKDKTGCLRNKKYLID